MAIEGAFERRRHFADSGFSARRFDREVEQIAVGARAVFKRFEGGVDFDLLAVSLEARQLFELHRAHFGVVDLQHRHIFLLGQFELVHADDGLMPSIDARLRARRGFFDAGLWQALVDRLGHAAEFLDLFDMRPGLRGEIGGEAFDVVGATPRIGGARHPAFALQ